MILFDSHCHIDDSVYNRDLDQMLTKNRGAGVSALMIAGIDLASVQKAISIAAVHDNIGVSAGIHPHYAAKATPEIFYHLKELAKESPYIKAWGETGLDFNRMFSPQKIQESCFITQLHIAQELNLPLIFHERDSEGRFYEILKSEASTHLSGVVHCFSGTREELFKYLDMGYYIGITGILTILKRGTLLRELAPLIPEDRILIETDAPYLTPSPEKNKFRRNEPRFVKSVLLKLAELRKTDPERLSRVIFENTRQLYGFPAAP